MNIFMLFCYFAQMSPMNWTLIFIMNFFSFILVWVFIFYLMNINNKNLFLNTSKSKKYYFFMK